MTHSGKPIQTDPVLRVFYDCTRFPCPKVLAYLREHGVARRAVIFDGSAGIEGHSVGAARVTFDGCGDFTFAETDDGEAVGAFVVVARDADGSPLDLVAWHPRTNTVGSYFGRAAILGLQDYYAPQLLGLPILHRSVLAWLQAERRGAVIIHRERAGRMLLDTPGRIAVADDAAAEEVRAVLLATVDLTRIVVPKPAETVARLSHG